MSAEPLFHDPMKLLTQVATFAYFEFINAGTLSSGIYVLQIGETKKQKPHIEDELYFGITGKSSMVVGDKTFQVSSGDAIFVPACLSHRFFNIVEDLKLVVFF